MVRYYLEQTIVKIIIRLSSPSMILECEINIEIKMAKYEDAIYFKLLSFFIPVRKNQSLQINVECHSSFFIFLPDKYFLIGSSDR